MPWRLAIQEAGCLSHREEHDDPVQAEAAYWRLCRTRTAGPGLLLLDPDAPASQWPVAKAAYGLDADWPEHLPRETSPDRAHLWTLTADGYAPPSPIVLRGVLAALGWSQQRLGLALGRGPRIVRYWVSGDPARPLGFGDWATIRSWVVGPRPQG